VASKGKTEWLSITELGAELGIPVRTIYAWRTLGKGPRGHHIGRHVRFRRADIEAWLATLTDSEPKAATGAR